MNNDVHVHQEGPICWITLDRPSANAIDCATSRRLHTALQAFEQNPTLRVAILTGGGTRFFSAGWDLKAAAQGEAIDADHGPGGFAGITEFFSRTKPVIAAVNGLAVGGGFEMALACDFIIATETAQFFLPESTLGILPDSGGLFRLVRRLPRSVALDLVLTGRRMAADEALSWGLVNQITASQDDLMDNARAWAERLVQGAPLAQRAALEMLEATEMMTLPQAFAHQRHGDLPYYRKMLNSRDAQDGILAFSEGRPPHWTGQ